MTTTKLILLLTLCCYLVFPALLCCAYAQDTTSIDMVQQTGSSLQANNVADAKLASEVAELEKALHQEQLINTRTVYGAFLIGMVLFFVTAQAVYATYQLHVLKRQNLILTEQLADALEYMRNFPLIKSQGQMQSEAEKQAAEPLSEQAAEQPELDTMSDAELYEYINEVVCNEKLYLHPVCDRQTLVERFHLTEKRIGAAFSKGSPYKSVASFVRDKRLEYACLLLGQNPDVPIGDVAAASGFPSYPRFATDFKAKYAISPTEFREQESV